MAKSKVTPIRAAGQAPDEARPQLDALVTELNGIATVLRTDITVVDPNDVYAAVAEWVARIASDLEALERRTHPATGASR